MDDINKKCKIIIIKKEKATILVLHHLFEKVLDLIPVKEGEDKENSDSKNPFQFR